MVEDGRLGGREIRVFPQFSPLQAGPSDAFVIAHPLKCEWNGYILRAGAGRGKRENGEDGPRERERDAPKCDDRATE